MIMRGGRALIGHLEADDVLFSFANAPRRLPRLNPPAKSVIADAIHFARFLLFARLVETLGRTKTGIGMPFRDKQIGITLVYFPALCLAVGPVLATVEGTLIWREAQPLQTAYDLFLSAGHKSFLISIFKTQNKLSAGLTGNQVGKEGIACIGEVKSPGRRGSNSSSCWFYVQKSISQTMIDGF